MKEIKTIQIKCETKETLNLLQKTLWVNKKWDYHELWRRLFPIGIDMILTAVDIIACNRCNWVEQDEAAATWEPSWDRPRLKRNELLQIGPKET